MESESCAKHGEVYNRIMKLRFDVHILPRIRTIPCMQDVSLYQDPVGLYIWLPHDSVTAYIHELEVAGLHCVFNGHAWRVYEYEQYNYERYDYE